MDPTALCYYESAQRLYLPTKPIPEIDGFEIKLAKHRYYFCRAQSSFNRTSGTYITQNKYLTNRLLEAAGIPVPKAILLTVEDFKKPSFPSQINRLKYPLVIKPVYGRQGKGVLCNIKTFSELKKALEQLFSLSSEKMIIEEFHANLLAYRVLVFQQKILGIVLRYPAQVIGDGLNTIKQLVELTNVERQKINSFLGMIQLDEEAQICLKEQNIEADYVPESGEKIALGYTCNATRGGTYQNIHSKMCPENRDLMIRVAKTINLKLVGIDVQSTDLKIPMTKSQGVIIEANEVPSIRIHEQPMQGSANWVTRKIMRYFIYRHPFAYIRALYLNSKIKVYIKSFFILITGTMTYWILKSTL